MSQSSNDVIPTAIHVSAALAVRERLLPALEHLAQDHRAASAASSDDVVKTGRTHLMDAMPITLGQELGGWAAQMRTGMARLHATEPRILALAQGGTAVGTGINAHPEFAARFAEALAERTGLAFRPSANFFESLSSQDAAVELSGQLRTRGREPDEDRQRPALDEQRSAGRSRRRSPCPRCSRAAASCRARSIR